MQTRSCRRRKGPWAYSGAVTGDCIWLARAPACTRCDLGGDHPPGDHLAAGQFPGPRRGPDHDAEPAAADIPAISADVDSVSSARHSCHRSPGCTMPATATTCGRAPASRRAAITISAGVRTLTTSAWAHLAPGHHRDRSPSSPPPATPKRSTTVAAIPSPLRHDPVSGT
jgi:hypothetical protein